MRPDRAVCHASVIVPLWNEAGNLPELHRRLRATLSKLACDWKIIFVDDGSTDNSAEVIRELSREDSSVIGLRFSRNFGHELASTAGLDIAKGDFVVLMDADLQDPPELLEDMVCLWREGYDIVYGVRKRRVGESAFKLWTAWLFYRLLNRLSDVVIPIDAGDFRLMDTKVLQAVQRCREHDRFVRGLVAWTGFRSCPLPYDRSQRHSGETKYPAVKLFFLALDAAIGFSIAPLRVASTIGFAVTFVSMTIALVVILQKICFGIDLPGYALLASGLFFLGGVQMMLLGIMGEYIGRIYRQAQSRPLYLISETIGDG